jgi:histone acetyltransferase (RNA polymerase elongator complex component)
MYAQAPNDTYVRVQPNQARSENRAEIWIYTKDPSYAHSKFTKEKKKLTLKLVEIGIQSIEEGK